MSTVTVRLSSICAGGNHLTFNVSGDASLSQIVSLSMLSEPIDEQDVVAFLSVLCRLAKRGRTLAQARTLLQAGVTVTV